MGRSTFLFGILLIGLLGAMAAAPLLVQPPKLRLNDVAGQFDSRRAETRLAYVLGDERPHPADSIPDDEVRARLVSTLQHLGLRPIVRDQLACNELFKQRGVSCARVRNVIAVLGPRTGKALLLNSHYDSVAAGPGAADDGIGVATMLEVASILEKSRLGRPVILLFNEGEELGLLGARAFLADPLSTTVDSLVNLDARGVSGPVNMFETSRPNAAAVATFATAVDHPAANSLSADPYRLMPNYTDVNSFSERGWLTLNFAPIGNETRYHSPGDDLPALDPATLQDMGDQVLALAEVLGGRSVEARQGNWIFMDVSRKFFVRLPLAEGQLLLVFLLIAFAAATLSRGGFRRSAVLVAGTMAGSAALAWACLSVVGMVRPGMFWRAHPLWAHLATFAAVLLVGSLLLGTVARGPSVKQLRTTFWLIFLSFGALTGAAAPGGIIFFLFPPLIVGASMIASRWWRGAERAGSVAAILFLYFSWGATLGLLEELLNGGPIWLFAPLGSLLLLPALIETKILVERAPRAAAAAAGILMIAALAGTASAPAYSADRQQRFVLQHVADARQGKNWWSVVNDGAPLPRRFGPAWERGRLPFSDLPRWYAAAPVDPASRPPEIRLLSEVRQSDERTLLLRIYSDGNDVVDLVAPEDSRIRSAGVSGFIRPINENEAGNYFLRCTGRACEGMTLELTTGRTNPISFLVVGSRYGLPRSAAPLIGATSRFARPQYSPNASITFAHVNL